MKQAKNRRIIFGIIMLTLVLLVFNNTRVFAVINETYSGTTAATNDAWAGEVDSTILDLLAQLVYKVGGFLEWILGTIFRLLTGVSDFPWADKIVFNAVPLLDVNFINPDYRSFVGAPGLREVLQDVYATVLTLAITFFGIVVLITAIKLVLTTIASEKAKYKQAIVSWVTGFVTLFCIHYAISFMFYLNEELVKVASNMVTAQLKDADNLAHAERDSLVLKLIENVRSSGVTYNGKNGAEVLEENYDILVEYTNLASGENSKGISVAITGHVTWTGLADESNDTKDQYQALVNLIAWAAYSDVSAETIADIRGKVLPYVSTYYIAPLGISDRKPYVGQALKESEYNRLKLTDYGLDNEFMLSDALGNSKKVRGKEITNKIKPYEYFSLIAPHWQSNIDILDEKESYKKVTGYQYLAGKTPDINTYYILSDGLARVYAYYDEYESAVKWLYSMGMFINTEYYWTDVLDDLIRLKSVAAGNSSGNGNSSAASSLIPNLATYFKYNAYGKTLGEHNNTVIEDDTGDVKIQNMLMYAILVGQSLILFIAYVKRLFYVILLALMAPMVVVFDFFQKFGK